MNNHTRGLSHDEINAVSGGADGYCGTQPPRWPHLPGSLFDPEPAPWQPIGVFGGH